ncbi:thiamine phosphate synthase [Brevibacillus sp. SYP-B805]|uniref:thiamine phosphate synthase n=1 Tax=Brevibacillus sp. SYP-B805 TaxID=1578199 RepID=UPI0013E9D50E|nr:thiamine phosphate synthase [Brevibacillus sp. SYP-B805]NGQ96279.1 thiamine phosphate synthase [Brevibacillus sp. SYP-B805]
MQHTLHLVTSGTQPLSHVAEIVKAAARGGIDYLHLREKQRTARELMEWVETLAQHVPRERIIVNDRVDVAAAGRCGGVHLAYHSLTPAEARPLLHSGQRVGRSVHSIEEAHTASRQGADYLFYGHIYPSGSKPGMPPRGTAALAELVGNVRVPVIAIGGITPENVDEVLQTGCAGIAVLSGITAAADPEAAARAYRLALDRRRTT